MPERITAKKVESDLMLYDSLKDDIHILNQTAALIYELKVEGKEEDKIVEAVIDQFELADREKVRTDVKKCLEELESKDPLGKMKNVE